MVLCEKAGVEFDDQLTFWDTPPLMCLGTATRAKKIMAVNIQVYACAFYIDVKAASAALHSNGASLDALKTIDGAADALLAGPFRKVLFVQMTRTVTGSQFIGAMLEAATPRLGGQCKQELAQLKGAFGMSLKAGDTFLMATDGGAKVSFSHFNAGTTDFSKPKPLLEINHELFAHALFDIYLGHPHLVIDKHPSCKEVIEALKRCHAENPVAKFWGVCNDQKFALDRCFAEEKVANRKRNLAKARAEQERYKQKLRTRSQADTGADNT